MMPTQPTTGTETEEAAPAEGEMETPEPPAEPDGEAGVQLVDPAEDRGSPEAPRFAERLPPGAQQLFEGF